MAAKNGGSKLSNAERVARWRQRQRASPRKHEEYKRKERERYERKKKRGVVKPISEMTKREQKSKRKQWRESSSSYYNRRKKILKAIENNETPPPSPENAHNYQVQVARQKGRKKVRRDRSKAYREIFRLRVALKKEERLKEKYKKRFQRQGKALNANNDAEEENLIRTHSDRKAILLYSVIIKRMKRRYKNTKKHDEKRKISSLVCATGLIKKYKLADYAKKMLGLTHHQMKKMPVKRTIHIKATRVRQRVHEFYERDDNSRVKPDKKATITRKGEKKQIRILNDDMKHLHQKYNAELGQRKISYSLFCKLRPFWVRAPTARDRDTCLCKLHENLCFKLETAHQARLLRSKNINDIVMAVTCNGDLDNKECMYRTCNNCKNKTVHKNEELNMGKQVQWKMWKNKRVATHVRVVRELESGSLETLDTEINKEVERVARHIFNIRHQFNSIASLKENMTENEVLVHIDFSENYNCKLDAEIQSMHFGASQRQVSVHTGIIYSKQKIYPFATLSDCLVHSPAGIWGHLKPVLEFLQTEEQGKTTIHFLSDGPTTQYRNKTNMFLFSTKIFDIGFRSGTWNYLEAGHGKGAADGIGAAVKRTGDRHVLAGHDVRCAADLKNALKDSTIHVFEVKESDIMENDIPPAEHIKAVPQTMRIHQVMTNQPGVVRTREVSCFCNPIDAGGCGCFNPVMTEFGKPKKLDTSSIGAEGDRCSDGDNILDLTSANATGDRVAQGTTPANASGDKVTRDNTSSDTTENTEDTCKLPEVLLKMVQTVDEDLIGRYIVVEYDGLPYPGEVLDVDEEDIEVKVMHKIGRNRFFWPLIDDTLWYHKDKVVTMLDDAPERVTGRHCQINNDVWQQIETILDL